MYKNQILLRRVLFMYKILNSYDSTNLPWQFQNFHNSMTILGFPGLAATLSWENHLGSIFRMSHAKRIIYRQNEIELLGLDAARAIFREVEDQFLAHSPGNLKKTTETRWRAMESSLRCPVIVSYLRCVPRGIVTISKFSSIHAIRKENDYSMLEIILDHLTFKDHNLLICFIQEEFSEFTDQNYIFKISRKH